MRYFRHLVDAHNDIKIRKLISLHGAYGYSVWWITLELIGLEGSGGKLSTGKVTAADVGNILDISSQVVEAVWKDCQKLTLLTIENNLISCAALEKYTDEYTDRIRNQLQAEATAKEVGPKVIQAVATSLEKYSDRIKEVLSYLNVKTGKQYRWQSKDNQLVLVARLKDGYNVEDLKKVVDNMAERWLGDEDMEQYLRPSTLFRRSKIEGYLNIDKGMVAKLKELSRGIKRG